MPTIMLRGLPSEWVARLRTYARDTEQSPAAAIQALVTIALDHLDARRAGGQARADQQTAEARSDLARRAAVARWSRER